MREAGEEGASSCDKLRHRWRKAFMSLWNR
jgi:hypothetical protein